MNVPKYLGAGATAVVSGPAGAGAGVVTTSMVHIRKLIHICLEQCNTIYLYGTRRDNIYECFTYLRQVCELHELAEGEQDELHDVEYMDCKVGKRGRGNAHTCLDVDIGKVLGNALDEGWADTHMVDDGHKLVLVQHGKRMDGDGLVHEDELERALHDKQAHDVG